MLSLGFNIDHYQWILFAFALISLCLSIWFYRKNNGSLNEVFEQRPWSRYLLIGLRSISLFLLLAFLLNPVLKLANTEIEKPKIIIAQDVSSSIQYGFLGENKQFDSLQFDAYLNKIAGLEKSLEEKYDVVRMNFGSVAKFDGSYQPTSKETNFSNLLSDINNLYSGQNLASVVVASDGIYNKGINPNYQNLKSEFSINTIALGDTTSRKDLIVNNVNFNPIVYLGNDFTIETFVESKNANGVSSIKIERFDSLNKVHTEHIKNINFQGHHQSLKHSFQLSAKRKGYNKYRISVRQIDGEQNIVNNSKEIYIEVIDGRQKILILADAPHPDISTLKNAINQNQSFQADYIKPNEELEKNIDYYDLVIFHQIPSLSNKWDNLLQKTQQLKIPSLFIIGAQTDLKNKLYSEDKSKLRTLNFSPHRNDANGVYNEEFLLFNLSEHTQFTLQHLPPLNASASTFTVNGNMKHLLLQKIGSVQTDYPLLSFSNSEEHKIAFLLGEGIWKWKIHDYLMNESHEAINEIITKTVQYLALKTDKRKFRVNAQKSQYLENETIEFEAQVFNDSYELNNNADVSLTLYANDGTEYPYEFKRINNAYSLDIGNLPHGIYKYIANTHINDKKETVRGEISVQKIELEELSQQANHKLLHQLASKHNGNNYYENELQQLAEDLLNETGYKSVSFTKYQTNSIINILWLFILLILPISVEWFLRKWYGSY